MFMYIYMYIIKIRIYIYMHNIFITMYTYMICSKRGVLEPINQIHNICASQVYEYVPYFSSLILGVKNNKKKYLKLFPSSIESFTK